MRHPQRHTHTHIYMQTYSQFTCHRKPASQTQAAKHAHNHPNKNSCHAQITLTQTNTHTHSHTHTIHEQTRTHVHIHTHKHTHTQTHTTTTQIGFYTRHVQYAHVTHTRAPPHPRTNETALYVCALAHSRIKQVLRCTPAQCIHASDVHGAPYVFTPHAHSYTLNTCCIMHTESHTHTHTHTHSHRQHS